MNQLKKYFNDKEKEAQKREVEKKLHTLEKLKEADEIRIRMTSTYEMILEHRYNGYIDVMVPLRKIFSRKDVSIFREKIFFSGIIVEKGTPIYNYIINKVENYLNLQNSKN